MGAGMLGRVEVLGGRPDPLAPSRLSPTSAYQKRMRSGDLVPVSGRNPIPSWPARNRQRSVPQMHVCKLFSGVSNAGAESYDAWAQRSLKAKGGEKFSLRGHRVPAGPPQGKGWDAELRTYGCCAGRGEKGAKPCVPTANAIPCLAPSGARGSVGPAAPSQHCITEIQGHGATQQAGPPALPRPTCWAETCRIVTAVPGTHLNPGLWDAQQIL